MRTALITLLFAAIVLAASNNETLANTNLTPGTFVKIGAVYNEDTNRFSRNVPKGEREACFQIAKVTEKDVTLKHISGTYKPWWSDTTYAPATYHDTWFSSEHFLDNNPGSDPLAELRQIFTAVSKC